MYPHAPGLLDLPQRRACRKHGLRRRQQAAVGGDVLGVEPLRSDHSVPVPGTPRWAVCAAYVAALSVVPSALWRTAVGFGLPLGWSDEQLRIQQMPGSGTVYVVALSVVSIGAAALTLGLVYQWGEVTPRVLPLIGGRIIPPLAAVVPAFLGGVAVVAICAMSAANWDTVSGFADKPRSGWALLMIVCYLPALLWGPLLLSVTWAYWRAGGPGPG